MKNILILIVIWISASELLSQNLEIRKKPTEPIRINKYNSNSENSSVNQSASGTTNTGTTISFGIRAISETNENQNPIIIKLKEDRFTHNNANCNESIFSYKNNYYDLTIVDESLLNNIYPGRLIEGYSIVEKGKFENYILPTTYSRMPYKISFKKNDGNSIGNAVIMHDVDGDGSLDKTDYISRHNEFKTQNKQPNIYVSSYFQFFELNSLQQFETDFGITLNQNLRTWLDGIPPSINPIAVVNSQLGGQVRKTRLVLKMVKEVYNAGVVPTNEDFRTLIEPTSESLSQNVCYVNSITYGKVEFILFESDFPFDVLVSTIEKWMGLDITPRKKIDIPDYFKLNIHNNIKSELSRVVSKVKSFELDIENNLVHATQKINGWLIDDATLQSSDIKPIRLTLKSIKSNESFYASYQTKIVSKRCTNFKYDVSLKLKYIEAVKVDEWWEDPVKEDLYGSINIYNFSIQTLSGISQLLPNPEDIYLFKRDGDKYEIGESDGKKEYKESGKSLEIVLAKNVMYDDIKSMKFSLHGDLKDWEPLTAFSYECRDCREITIGPERIRSIDSIVPSQTKSIQFGSDNYFELNFFQGKSHIRFWFEILVTAK